MSKTDGRRQKILEIIAREGKVRIIDLSREFGASLVTVRGDLRYLESKGLLQYVTGGAVQSRADAGRALLLYEKQNYPTTKLAIARKASTMITEGETLFINSGTTTRLFALELKSFSNIKIVTNSVIIAQELSGYPNINLTLLGGKVNPQFFFSYGADAISQLMKYKADKAVLSVDGIDAEAGISTYHAEEGEINSVMMERSYKTMIVADATKIGKESFSKFSSLNKIDTLITSICGAEKINKIKELGINVIIEVED